MAFLRDLAETIELAFPDTIPVYLHDLLLDKMGGQ